MKRANFKKDRFQKARGGQSRLLIISCAKCGEFAARYQKDGPGTLKRMYLDRIVSPATFAGIDAAAIKKTPPLSCARCGQVIGVPFLYEPENRPSFRLLEGAVSKKIDKER